MALFKYDKPGKGIDKDTPRAKGIFLYFDLLWRKLGRLIVSNFLYFITSLPILFLYYVLAYAFFGAIMTADADPLTQNQAAVIATVLVATLWGTGPVSCGLDYILRNLAREEHTWVNSDFFEQSKIGFRHGIVFFLVDLVMLVCTCVSLMFYWQLSSSGGAFAIAMTATVIAILVLYTAMHFYLYQVEVTFSGGILNTYKNAFLLAAGTMPMCILLSATVIAVSLGFLTNLSPIGIVVFAAVIWLSAVRFIPEFYAARFIKRTLIKD